MLMFVLGVVLLEVVLQWRVNHSAPDEAEWLAVSAAVRGEKKAGDLVVIAPEWATQGRVYLRDLIAPKDHGRFDTTRYGRVLLVSLNGASTSEVEGLERVKSETFGRLSLEVYNRSAPAIITYDFVENASTGYRQNGQRIVPGFVIDNAFKPRLVIPVPLRPDGVKVVFPDVPAGGDVLRGYGVVGNRSGQFDVGSAVTIAASVDGAPIGRVKVRNMGPLEPFEFELPKRTEAAEVVFEIHSTSGLKREFGFAADIREREK